MTSRWLGQPEADRSLPGVEAVPFPVSAAPFADTIATRRDHHTAHYGQTCVVDETIYDMTTN
jgi:hypothetical protein